MATNNSEFTRSVDDEGNNALSPELKNQFLTAINSGDRVLIEALLSNLRDQAALKDLLSIQDKRGLSLLHKLFVSGTPEIIQTVLSNDGVQAELWTIA